jgi:hypothetical protein
MTPIKSTISHIYFHIAPYYFPTKTQHSQTSNEALCIRAHPYTHTTLILYDFSLVTEMWRKCTAALQHYFFAIGKGLWVPLGTTLTLRGMEAHVRH